MKHASGCTLLGLTVISILSGCAPIPYFRHHAPALSGEVLLEGKPVADAQIEVTSLLDDERRLARTDAAGRFQTEAIDEFHFTTPLLGDPLIRYQMQIVYGGISYRGYERALMGNHLPAARLICELSDAPRACREVP